MPFPQRPKRLHGFRYDQPGPLFHCRLGCLDRAPYLAVPAIADLVVESLRSRHGNSAEILAFCVMPDHLHLLLALLRQGQPLSRWISDLKRWIVRQARTETDHPIVWQPNFYEHILRKSEELSAVARYILENPVRRGLVTRWQDYHWCGSLAWRLGD